MEGKEKIVLNDGTVYPIENGASENQVQVVVQSVDEFPGIFKKFTEPNLESYQIQNAEGLTCATRKNKYLADAVVEERESDVLVTFHLADVDMVQKQIDALKSNVDAMESNAAAFEAGQMSQNGAIVALDKAVCEIEERGGM